MKKPNIIKLIKVIKDSLENRAIVANNFNKSTYLSTDQDYKYVRIMNASI
jgi:hypothetical protein